MSHPIDCWAFPASAHLGMVAAGEPRFSVLGSIVGAARAAGSTDAEIEHWIKFPHGITLRHDATTCTIAAMAAHVDAVEPFVFYVDDEPIAVACLEQDEERTAFRLIVPSGDVRRVTVRTPAPDRLALFGARVWIGLIADAMIAGGLA